MTRLLLTILFLGGLTAEAAAAQKPRGRFSKGRMSAGSDDASSGRRWGRGRSSAANTGKVSYKANTSAFTRMGDDGPQNYGLSAPVAGAKVQYLGFQTSPGGPFSQFGPETGNRIAYEESKGQNLDTNRGIHMGPRDKTPPPTPGSGGGSGGASGANAITPNAPLNGSGQ